MAVTRAQKNELLQDDFRLHKLSREGNLRKIRDFVEKLNDKALADQLTNRKGEFGYTPLHEAVASGKAEVLDYLLTKTKNAYVNCSTNSGHTPLHLAASLGHRDCAKKLLEHTADIYITNKHGKTPKQMAELNFKARIIKLLRSEEIIKNVEIDCERWMELLRINKGQLEPDCLNRALMAATRNDNHFNIGKLVINGANSLDECLTYSQKENKPYARAMLLLIKAAASGNQDIVQRLFGETMDNPHISNDPDFPDVQKVVLSGEVSTTIPIEISHRNGHLQLQEELLLRTHVNQVAACIYWDRLRLVSLEVSWLKRIGWVKQLWLDRNDFQVLPNEMELYLKQVTILDLQYNKLSRIPRCLLKLPRLQQLDLSHNKLMEIPDIPEWSACLIDLDLSFNQLSTMPINVVAPAIRSLNISHNAFRTVPLCICSFVTLHSLNLSDNPDIRTLPAEMRRLSMLDRLYLYNLKKLRDPPRSLQNDPQACICYLNKKFHCVKSFYHMKLMVVGITNRGKTTLVKRLQGKKCGNHESTVGIDVSEWWLKPSIGKKPFHFRIWDFGGQQEYFSVHQCFLSQRSLYLLLFNLNHGEAGVQELKLWLNSIALRAPRSCVIIIGTHLDEISEDEREETDYLLNRVGVLAETYYKLQIVEVMPVGLKNRIENVGLLKEAIYNHAANYKTRAGQHIMGQKIPASYHALDKQLEVVQQEVRQGLREPIIHSEEFNSMVQQMNLADIQDAEELKIASLFLGDVGSLLHYDNRSHNLHELYFLDPQWLFDTMSRIVINPFVKKGILYFKDLPMLFKDDAILWKYFKQYLALLDHFEIALPLDNRRVLIPSMLPEECPKYLAAKKEKNPLVYSRHIMFNSTPPGFWSRLLSRIMQSIPQICFALDITEQSTLQGDTSDQENQDQHQMYSAPQLLPNFPSLPIAMQESYDVTDIQLDFWKTGLHYSDPELLTFRIESLPKSNDIRWKRKDGVLIVASPTNQGKKIFRQLVDLVISLSEEWYPGLTDCFNSLIPCFECLKEGRKDPFEFNVAQCLPEIFLNRTTMECGYYRDPAKNHTVALSDVVPELLLQDIYPNFLLNTNDLHFQEDNSQLLGKGSYGKVYKGKCHNQSVAIKKFTTSSENAFAELLLVAKILHECQHPCIIQIIGGCVHPFVALVLEEAPLNSLEFSIIRKKLPVHRLTLFRIAAEVATALHFLHGQRIIYRDLKASNVLLWTLNPSSLCHCKVADFGMAAYMAPVGTQGPLGTKGFIAPEALHIGRREQHSVYDHKADIFSFGMFLYQIISRRLPYYDIVPHHIDVLVEAGERPNLLDVYLATTGYHYLTMLMKKCWEDNPKFRPNTEEIIKTVCFAPMQSVMCVYPIRSKLSICHAIAITPANFLEAGAPSKLENELWVCCDGAEGAELNIYKSNTMAKVTKHFIKDNQVQCMALCSDHIWVSSAAGGEYSVVDIFNIATRELVHNIRMRESTVSCLTSAKDKVLIGTLEGYCFSFSNDVSKVRNNVAPHYKCVSEHAIDGITCTSEFIWVSFTHCIYLLNPDNLSLEGMISRDEGDEAFIGQLSHFSDDQFVWSAHLGGVLLTAWDAHNYIHSFDIDTCKLLQKIDDQASIHDFLITAMVPVLDTVWVGMATGHILIFHKENLLSWYRPYQNYVRFLSLIPGSGPCEMEKCMVVSGGKGFQPLVKDMGPDYEKLDEDGQPLDKSGVLVIWEAYEAMTMRQIKLVEEKSPNHLDTHISVRQMIHDGEFKDGTHINKVVQNGETTEDRLSYKDITPYSPDTDAQLNFDYFSSSLPKGEFTMGGINPTLKNEIPPYNSTESLESHTPDSNKLPPVKKTEDDHFTGSKVHERTIKVTATQPYMKEKVEMFEIELPGPDPDSTQVVCVACPKPPQLEVLLSELQVNASLSECNSHLEFRTNLGVVSRLQTQEELEDYLTLSNRPKLYVAKPK